MRIFWHKEYSCLESLLYFILWQLQCPSLRTSALRLFCSWPWSGKSSWPRSLCSWCPQCPADHTCSSQKTRVHCSEMKCCSVVSVCVEVCALIEFKVFSDVLLSAYLALLGAQGVANSVRPSVIRASDICICYLCWNAIDMLMFCERIYVQSIC